MKKASRTRVKMEELQWAPKKSQQPNRSRIALTKLRGREGGAGAERAILRYVCHLQIISTLKIGADCCQLSQYKLTKPNLILPNLTYPSPDE